MDPLSAEVLSRCPEPQSAVVERLTEDAFSGFDRKIVVLDDDPTGVQTVHDISVYTDWTKDSIRQGFLEDNSMFFILTNSRAMSSAETKQTHQEIARTIVEVSQKTGKDFILISRSDSTLRGHYPLETETLRSTVEAYGDKRYCGEIICPYFKEGGRFTIHDVHYVQEGETLVPAGKTEFALDKSFGYHASHLGEWCQEKTGGAFRAGQMIYIELDELRACRIEAIKEKLCRAEGFQKVIVNAVSNCDVQIFLCAYLAALKEGKEFIFRTAAAIPKALGRVSDKPLLTTEEVVQSGNPNGGIVLIGSHVKKTTDQLEALKELPGLKFLEFNQHRVLEPNGLEDEVARVLALTEANLAQGCSVVVYTRRDRLDLPNGTKEEQLSISVRISDAVTSIISGLQVRPRFIVAKGGITSSDVGTKALRVRRATVMGQIAPGVPVWRTGAESKFPDIPYVIFPGNVGQRTTLRDIVAVLVQ